MIIDIAKRCVLFFPRTWANYSKKQRFCFLCILLYLIAIPAGLYFAGIFGFIVCLAVCVVISSVVVCCLPPYSDKCVNEVLFLIFGPKKSDKGYQDDFMEDIPEPPDRAA